MDQSESEQVRVSQNHPRSPYQPQAGLIDMISYNMISYDMISHDIIFYVMILYHMISYDMITYDMIAAVDAAAETGSTNGTPKLFQDF